MLLVIRILASLTPIALAAEQPAVVERPVAIVHFNQLQAKKLEGTAKDVTLIPVIGHAGQMPYFRLRNDLFTPRDITLRILDLTEQEYDLYIDRKLIGTRKREELEAGIPLSLPGSQVSPECRDYFTRVHTRAGQDAKRYEAAKDADGIRCREFLQACARWIEGIQMGDNRIRTRSVIVAPAGKPLTVPDRGLAELPLQDFPASVRRLADVLQMTRRSIASSIHDPMYRFDTLEALTPMDFALEANTPLSPGANVTVRATLSNWTDRRITGKVKLTVPDGWKVTNPAQEVKMAGYSKSAQADFELAVPKADQSAKAITAQAELSVEGVELKLLATLPAR